MGRGTERGSGTACVRERERERGVGQRDSV